MAEGRQAAFSVSVDAGQITLDTVVGTKIVGGDPEEGPEYGDQTLGDVIVYEAVRQILHSGDSRWSHLYKKVEEIRTEVIREVVEAEIRAALTEPFIPTTQFGEAKGEALTLREVIAEQARKALTIRTEQHYSGPKLTVAEKMIAEETQGALKKELVEAIKAEREKVVAAMRLKAAEVIAETLAAAVSSGR